MKPRKKTRFTKSERKELLKEKLAFLRSQGARILADIIDPTIYHLEHRQLAKKRNWM